MAAGDGPQLADESVGELLLFFVVELGQIDTALGSAGLTREFYRVTDASRSHIGLLSHRRLRVRRPAGSVMLNLECGQIIPARDSASRLEVCVCVLRFEAGFLVSV